MADNKADNDSDNRANNLSEQYGAPFYLRGSFSSESAPETSQGNCPQNFVDLEPTTAYHVRGTFFVHTVWRIEDAKRKQLPGDAHEISFGASCAKKVFFKCGAMPDI